MSLKKSMFTNVMDVASRLRGKLEYKYRYTVSTMVITHLRQKIHMTYAIGAVKK